MTGSDFQLGDIRISAGGLLPRSVRRMDRTHNIGCQSWLHIWIMWRTLKNTDARVMSPDSWFNCFGVGRTQTLGFLNFSQMFPVKIPDWEYLSTAFRPNTCIQQHGGKNNQPLYRNTDILIFKMITVKKETFKEYAIIGC